MTTATKGVLDDATRDALDYWGLWSSEVELPGGFSAGVRIMHDETSDLFDGNDTVGEIAPARRDSERPTGFDGAARKIHAGRNAYWWQPPADVKGDAKATEGICRYVRGWLADDWTYVGVIVRLTFPPCGKCGTRKTEEGSLWGIESNADGYLGEVAGELLAELLSAAS